MPAALRLVMKALRLQQAGHIAARALDLGQPGHAGALGLLLLLEAATDDAGGQLAGYAQALLGALEDYDRARGMHLVETLGVYLDAGASVALAAERLSVHRNTLAYRIARIVAVSGHDLADPGVRFDLQLALAARRLERA
jgi:DNA-binding PucR family transcriptional regulator